MQTVGRISFRLIGFLFTILWITQREWPRCTLEMGALTLIAVGGKRQILCSKQLNYSHGLGNPSLRFGEELQREASLAEFSLCYPYIPSQERLGILLVNLYLTKKSSRKQKDYVYSQAKFSLSFLIHLSWAKAAKEEGCLSSACVVERLALGTRVGDESARGGAGRYFSVQHLNLP